ncbi:MAG: adenylate/guanylate cyclase domain-containing protein [Alphaproteobacteria bacterium]|jgi:class 3 adenylate cyclase|nr:adenylate/guanylate cyclase domain-containing protein [Alphaproteobacteria bacterium]
MTKTRKLRPSFAVLMAATVAGLVALSTSVLTAFVVWTAYENTLRELREQGGATVTLMARLADPAASPEALSRELDAAALLVGGVGFALDREGRLRAHPHIASGLFAAGGPTGEHDAIIAALQGAAPVGADLSGGSVAGRLVHLRGDDYGVFLKPLATPEGWRVGLYLARPSLWRRLPPLERLALAVAASLLMAALVAYFAVKRALRPLQRLAEAAETAAEFETETIAPLPEGRLAETAAATAALNRLIESRRLTDGLVAQPLARRLAANPSTAVPHRASVTVMAAGLAGFDELTTGLDDEAVVDLLRRHLTLVAGRVHAADGIVIEIAGDILVALWDGTAGHARQAVEAVREIRRLADQMQGEGAAREVPTPQLSIGLASGEAIVGNLGPAGETRLGALGAIMPLARWLERQARGVADGSEPVVALAIEATVEAAAIGGGARPLGGHAIGDDGQEIAVFRL